VEEIGLRLRAARESRNISLGTAETETRIRRKYLEALESGQPADLPGEVYLKGFLRTYGNYLGLDGTALVDRYKESREPRRAAVQNAATTEPPRGEAANTAPSRASATQPRTRLLGAPQVSARGVTIVVVALAVVASIGYLGWLIALQFSTKPDPGAAAPPSPAATTKQPDPAPTPAPVVPELPKSTMTRSTGEDVLFAVPAKEITVRLEFTQGERVWMRAYIAEKQVYEGFPTDPLEYKGAQLRLRMGNMTGVSLVVNGQRFERPLEKGPYTLIFTGQP